MRRKIAPTLQWGMREGIICDPYAKAELRALIAVARAAEEMSSAWADSSDPANSSRCCNAANAITRALSRLTQPSGSRRGPRGGGGR